MANAVGLVDSRISPCVKIELMEEFLTPKPTCALPGFSSPFAEVVRV